MPGAPHMEDFAYVLDTVGKWVGPCKTLPKGAGGTACMIKRRHPVVSALSCGAVLPLPDSVAALAALSPEALERVTPLSLADADSVADFFTTERVLE